MFEYVCKTLEQIDKKDSGNIASGYFEKKLGNRFSN